MASSFARTIAGVVGATIVDLQEGVSTFRLPTPAAVPTDDVQVGCTNAPLVSLVEGSEDGCDIIALHMPHLMSKASAQRIFQMTAPYTSRAFASDLSSMSEDDVTDHYNHTFGGDGITFLIGCSQSSRDAKPRIFGHMNVVLISSAGADQPILYVNGICCDPDFQGFGYARRLLTAGVRSLRCQARYVALRTMNIAVVKLLKLACASIPPGHGVSCDESCSSLVYPIDSFDPVQRPDLVVVAETLAERLGWSSLESRRLILKAVYPSFLIPVFMGQRKGTELELKVDALIDRDGGDAFCCIADLS